MRSGSTCWNEDTSGVGGLQGRMADFEVVRARAIDQSFRPSDFPPGPSTSLRAERGPLRGGCFFGPTEVGPFRLGAGYEFS